MSMDAMLQDPTIWVAVAFLIFLVGFIKLGLPFIVRGLDGKAAAIARELDEAKRLRAEAEALLVEYKEKQSKVLAEADALLEHAKQDAQALKAQAEVAMKAAIERRTKQAQDAIARAESLAVADLRASLLEVAATAAKDALAAQVNAQTDATLIEAATKDLGAIVH